MEESCVEKKGLPSYNKQHITPENIGETSSMRNVFFFSSESN